MMVQGEKVAEGVDESSRGVFQVNRNQLEGSNKERITCEDSSIGEE